MRLVLLLIPAAMWAQTNVIVSGMPPQDAVTTIIHYTANVADYSCSALSTQKEISTIAVTTVTNASAGIMTATAHGLYFATGVTQVALVFISGATGGWATLNGFHLVTPTSANALSINVDTTAFGAWGSQSITMSTRAPKVTSLVWSVQPVVSDASGNQTLFAWAVPVPTSGTLANLVGGQTAYRFACTAPASYQ